MKKIISSALVFGLAFGILMARGAVAARDGSTRLSAPPWVLQTRYLPLYCGPSATKYPTRRPAGQKDRM